MDYNDELNAIREATASYRAAVKAYRLLMIGDDEFLAAQTAYKTAEARFDAAFVEAQSA